MRTLSRGLREGSAMAWLTRRLIGFAILSLIFGLVEMLWGVRPRRKGLRPGTRTDILHFLFTETLGQIATVLAILPVAGLIHALVPGSLRAWYHSLSGLVQFAVVFLLVDLVGYVSHRLRHEAPFLWKIHSVHHSSEELDWLASVRQHPFDKAITRAMLFVPLYSLGVTKASFGAFLGLSKGMGLLFHTNVNWDYGPLRKVFASPAFHHWHHSAAPIDKNFSGFLPLWDLLGGTFYLPEKELPSAYGANPPVPPGYLAQLLHPFRSPSGGVSEINPSEPSEPSETSETPALRLPPPPPKPRETAPRKGSRPSPHA